MDTARSQQQQQQVSAAAASLLRPSGAAITMNTPHGVVAPPSSVEPPPTTTHTHAQQTESSLDDETFEMASALANAFYAREEDAACRKALLDALEAHPWLANNNNPSAMPGAPVSQHLDYSQQQALQQQQQLHYAQQQQLYQHHHHHLHHQHNAAYQHHQQQQHLHHQQQHHHQQQAPEQAPDSWDYGSLLMLSHSPRHSAEEGDNELMNQAFIAAGGVPTPSSAPTPGAAAGAEQQALREAPMSAERGNGAAGQAGTAAAAAVQGQQQQQQQQGQQQKQQTQQQQLEQLWYAFPPHTGNTHTHTHTQVQGQGQGQQQQLQQQQQHYELQGVSSCSTSAASSTSGGSINEDDDDDDDDDDKFDDEKDSYHEGETGLHSEGEGSASNTTLDRGSPITPYYWHPVLDGNNTGAATTTSSNTSAASSSSTSSNDNEEEGGISPLLFPRTVQVTVSGRGGAPTDTHTYTQTTTKKTSSSKRATKKTTTTTKRRSSSSSTTSKAKSKKGNTTKNTHTHTHKQSTTSAADSRRVTALAAAAAAVVSSGGNTHTTNGMCVGMNGNKKPSMRGRRTYQIDPASFIIVPVPKVLPGSHLDKRPHRLCRSEECPNRYRTPGYFCEGCGGGRCQVQGCDKLHQGKQGLADLFFCRAHRKIYSQILAGGHQVQVANPYTHTHAHLEDCKPW